MPSIYSKIHQEGCALSFSIFNCMRLQVFKNAHEMIKILLLTKHSSSGAWCLITVKDSAGNKQNSKGISTTAHVLQNHRIITARTSKLKTDVN